MGREHQGASGVGGSLSPSGVSHVALLIVVILSAACSGSSATGDAGDVAPTDAGMPVADASPPVTDAGPVDPARFVALEDAVRADLAANSATAASVAVWLDGRVVWVGGFGALAASDARPPDEDTVFMIGSDTKKLTALALLQRVQAGQASLDTTVADVLPDLHMTLAPEFTSATIRQLLSHQGGIVDETEDTTTTTDGAFATYVYGTFAQTYYSMVPPGTFWNYSNPNFAIAGFLDQHLDGRMWPDIVEQDLFAPLGMHRTFARKSEVDADYAPGNGLSGNAGDTTVGPVPLADAWESAFMRPAGLVWSTPSDQMRLAAFLVDGDPTVLSPELLHEVVSGQVRTYPDVPGEYGFGLFIGRGIWLGDSYYDIPVWYHGGDTLSHTSTFYVLPEQRFAISILSNGDEDDFGNSVVAAMTSLVSLPAPVAGPDPPFDPTALDGLTGTYVDDQNLGDVIVTRSGDALSLRCPSLDAYHIPYDALMTHYSTRLWYATIDGESVDLSFIDGAAGQAYLRGREYVAVRAAMTTALRWPARRIPSRQTVLHAVRMLKRNRISRLFRRP